MHNTSKIASLVLAAVPAFAQDFPQPIEGPTTAQAPAILIRDVTLIHSARFIGIARPDNNGPYAYFILNNDNRMVVGIRHDFLSSQADYAFNMPVTQHKIGFSGSLDFANPAARTQGILTLAAARAAMERYFEMAPYDKETDLDAVVSYAEATKKPRPVAVTDIAFTGIDGDPVFGRVAQFALNGGKIKIAVPENALREVSFSYIPEWSPLTGISGNSVFVPRTDSVKARIREETGKAQHALWPNMVPPEKLPVARTVKELLEMDSTRRIAQSPDGPVMPAV